MGIHNHYKKGAEIILKQINDNSIREEILDMMSYQDKLDKTYIQLYNLGALNRSNVKRALFDECGELNHEMKKEWCYWKKSQKPIDKAAVLEELSDVFHFSLTIHMMDFGKTFDNTWLEMYRDYHKDDDWFTLLDCVSRGTKFGLYLCVILSEKLNFTFDEVYNIYLEKNAKNYQRIEAGY